MCAGGDERRRDDVAAEAELRRAERGVAVVHRHPGQERAAVLESDGAAARRARRAADRGGKRERTAQVRGGRVGPQIGRRRRLDDRERERSGVAAGKARCVRGKGGRDRMATQRQRGRGEGERAVTRGSDRRTADRDIVIEERHGAARCTRYARHAADIAGHGDRIAEVRRGRVRPQIDVRGHLAHGLRHHRGGATGVLHAVRRGKDGCYRMAAQCQSGRGERETA